MDGNIVTRPSIDLEDESTDDHDVQVSTTPLRKYVTIIGPKKDNKWICNYGCKADAYTGTYSRIRGHFLGRAPGQKAMGIAVCSKITNEEREAMRKEEYEAQKMFGGKTSRKGVQVVVPPTSNVGNTRNDSRIISDMSDLFSRNDIDGLIGRFFYGCGIPFNVARSPFFYDMVRGINEAPKGYKPPSAEKIRTSLLDKEKSKVERHLLGVKDQWPIYGVSIVSDGWSNIKHQPLINLVAVSGGRFMFLNTIDNSGDEKNGVFVAELLFKAIESIGVYNVVQILTDDTSACELAGEIIMKRYPHIFWSGCMAHTLSLLLKDLTASHHPNLKFIRRLYHKAKDILTYIRSHSMVSLILRKFSSLEGIQAKKRKFGHHYDVLALLVSLKDALISMVSSEEWHEIKNGNSSSKLHQEEIKKTILDNDFWDGLENVLAFMKPVWSMIFYCDSNGAVIGEIYQRMEDMITSLEVILSDKPELLSIVRCRAIELWQKMNKPLHILAYVLTPFYYSTTWLSSCNPKGERRMKPHADPDVQDVYLDVVDRLLGNSSEAGRARSQLGDFVSNTGTFARPQTIVDRETMPAVKWWSLHGASVPELSGLAIRVLSQSVSSSCSERVWSTCSFVENVVQNRVNADRAESLVFVHYNNRLLTRYRDDYEKAYKNWDCYIEDDLMEYDLKAIEDRELESIFSNIGRESGSSQLLIHPPQAIQDQRPGEVLSRKRPSSEIDHQLFPFHVVGRKRPGVV